MKPGMFFCTLIDTCFPHVSYKLLLHMVFVTDRIKWRHMFQEHMVRFIILRASVFDIINHRPAYCIRYWQSQWFMCFVLYEGQIFIFPVKVLETQIFDISNPKPKNTRKKDHRIVTFSYRTVPVNGRKHCFQFIELPYGRYFGTFRNSRHMDIYGIINGKDFGRIKKTQEVSDSTNILLYGFKTISSQRFQIRIADIHCDTFCRFYFPLLEIIHENHRNAFIMSDRTR